MTPCPWPRAGAVSYTHLDVYKRQNLEGKRSYHFAFGKEDDPVIEFRAGETEAEAAARELSLIHILVPDYPIPHHVDIMQSFHGIDKDSAGRVEMCIRDRARAGSRSRRSRRRWRRGW